MHKEFPGCRAAATFPPHLSPFPIFRLGLLCGPGLKYCGVPLTGIFMRMTNKIGSLLSQSFVKTNKNEG